MFFFKANSFVSLHLQRRLPFTNATPTPCTTASSSSMSIKPRLDESKSELTLDESKQSLVSDDNNNEYDMETDKAESNESDIDEEDSDENAIPVVGTLAQSAESKLSQFINDPTDIGRNMLKKHRKQHSMSDESLKNLTTNKKSNIEPHSIESGKRRAIKKTKVDFF